MVETRKRSKTSKDDAASVKKSKRRQSAPVMKSENLSTEIDKSEVLEVQKTSKRHSFTNLSNLPALAAVKEENEDPPGSTETESDDEKDGKYSIEVKMQQNIKDNAEFLSKLGIYTVKAELEEMKAKPKPTSRGLKTVKRVSEVLPRRQSLRIQNLDPEGGLLPDKPPVDRFGYSALDESELRKEGPLKMKEVLRNTDLQEAHGKFWGELNSSISKEAIQENRKKVDSDLKRFLKDTDKMKMNEFRVAKVVPNRIFSVAIHPSESKVLVVAGDKWGKIGFWDVKSAEDHDGVLCYEPHTRPVKCLRFQADQPDRLYSCSYDGLLRCCHFETGTFDELYSTPEEDDIIITGFDFLTPTSLIVSQADGYVVMVDTRAVPEKGVQRAAVASKTVRSVCIHPVKRNYVVTSSTDCTVKIWDLRQLKKKPQPIHTLPHSKVIESAYFSPITGNHLLTTAKDDRLRLYDASNIAKEVEISHSIKHNNQTGRWLSKFQAVWHPSRDDVFICGSMSRPRQIELFDSSGSLVKTFQDEDYLNSVCSLNAFHPTQNILVGGNSSGRMHVFM